MPSRQEGFGLVYLEAMNYAKPCVACRDDGGAEVVVDGETGKLVDQPINLAKLRKVLEEILGDEANAKRMGKAGLKRLNENFSSAAHQERIAKHVRNLLQ
jgi:glycosyltransferase involved in cell wall biosynthesis